MKKSNVVLLLAVLFFSISSYVHATPIRFDLVGGVDTYGNPFTGYLDFDNSSGIISYDSNGNPTHILYNITGYNFETIAGSAYGDDGSLLFCVHYYYDPPLVYPSPYFWLYGYVSAVEYGVKEVNLSNESTWVEFDNLGTGTVDQYSTLPHMITVNTNMFQECVNYSYYGDINIPYGEVWNFGSELTFQRQTETAPVPEPTTMLLLGTGLIGLAGFRKKMKR